MRTAEVRIEGFVGFHSPTMGEKARAVGDPSRYDRDVAEYDFDSAEFDEAARAATHQAFLDTLASGRPVFYIDSEGLNVMEFGDGRKFEPLDFGCACWRKLEIIRDLKANAA